MARRSGSIWPVLALTITAMLLLYTDIDGTLASSTPYHVPLFRKNERFDLHPATKGARALSTTDPTIQETELFGNIVQTRQYYATVQVGNQTFTAQLGTRAALSR